MHADKLDDCSRKRRIVAERQWYIVTFFCWWAGSTLYVNPTNKRLEKWVELLWDTWNLKDSFHIWNHFLKRFLGCSFPLPPTTVVKGAQFDFLKVLLVNSAFRDENFFSCLTIQIFDFVPSSKKNLATLLSSRPGFFSMALHLGDFSV